MAENAGQKPQSLKQLHNREKVLADRKARLKGELDQVGAELKDVRARRIEAERAASSEKGEKAKAAKRPASKAEAKPAAGRAGGTEE